MRITIVQGAFLPLPPVSGGAVEKIWFALGKEFARKGHDVTHVSRDHDGFVRDELIDGVHHIRVKGFDTPRSLLLLKWLDLLYTLRVIAMLPEADILVTNTFWMPILSRNPKHGRICVHVARYPKGQIRFYGAAARLHTVSKATKTAICRESPRIAARVKVIPNFVNVPATRPNAEEVNTDILYVGRVHPEKGIHLLVEAFDRLVDAGHRDWRLRIVGPWDVKLGGGGEEYFASLRKRAGENGQFIEWLGPVFDSAELNSIYSQATVFVYPSLAERGETFGLAPLEAMAAGCPPIVSSLQCFQDFIKVGLNGWTFDHRSPNAAANLAGLLKGVVGDTVSLARMREEAVKTARQFSLSNVAEGYLSDFAEILGQ